MSDETEVVIAATHQAWADRLVSWALDHGGEIRLRDHFIADRRDALEQSYDCLIVDADSPLLNQSLVEKLRGSHRAVVGVYDPDLLHTREQLDQLGVDAIVAKHDDPQTMVDACVQAAATHRQFADVTDGELSDVDTSLIEGIPGPPTGDDERSAGVTVVCGAADGVGATETAVATACALRRRGDSVLLADLDLVTPSLAQRLRLPLTAGLHLAIDAVSHRIGLLDDAVLPHHPSGLEVVVGVEHPRQWQQIDADDVDELLTALRDRRTHTVVHTSAHLEALPCDRHEVARRVVAAADRTIVVAEPTPPGLVELTRWMIDAQELADPADIHVALNRSGGDVGRSAENELRRVVSCASVRHLPTDKRVRRATWASRLVASGRWARAVTRLADTAVPAGSRVPRRRRRLVRSSS